MVPQTIFNEIKTKVSWISYLSHVTNSSSRFGPPQLQDVTFATGISTSRMMSPVTGLKQTTYRLNNKAKCMLPCTVTNDEGKVSYPLSTNTCTLYKYFLLENRPHSMPQHIKFNNNIIYWNILQHALDLLSIHRT